MTFVVLGASGGLGRALSQALAANGHNLVLLSSDPRDVSALATDLSLRYRVRVVPVAADLAGGEDYLNRLEAAVDALGGTDGLLFPQGVVAPSDDATLDAATAARLVSVNFLSVVMTIGRFLPALRRRPRAAIVGFGSVAAARGRGANVVYSASKRALESLFESLHHASVGTSVLVQLYVVGYLDTNLARGVTTALPKAQPERLAARVLRNLERDVGIAYFPRWWRPVCALVRWLPWRVFKRLRF